MFCSMDDWTSNRHSFEERDPQMPTLGTRVRRGPDWKWEEQDNSEPGTVIAHSTKGVFSYIMYNNIIEDFRYRFCLMYSFLSMYDLLKLLTYSIDGWLFVEWDHGQSNAYRYGPVCNKYDIKFCNEPRILCNESIATGCLVTRGMYMFRKDTGL